jgi:predicted transcriptional regulator
MSSNGKDKLGRKLLQIKEELEKKKSQRSELQGELKSLMKQLKEFGADTIEQAYKIQEKQSTELKKLELSIQEGIEEIEQLMEEGS